MKAEDWNAKYLVGQVVILTEDDSSKTKTKTRSEAWNLGCGIPVIKVEGKTGGYALERIQAIE